MFPSPDRRPRLRRTALLVVIAALSCVIGVSVSPPAVAVQDPGLVRKINSVMADPRVQRAKSSAVVLDATTGERIYSRNGIMPRIPASNTKILTAAAALETLGENFTFHTDVFRRNNVVNGVLNGPLYLKGYGDPTTRQSDFAA
ncbi:MAG TPA: D-alanyl-D-alanine carboxypeptidase, partial [Propionibacteriaceae bacterium]|nr:D-alanyl-D-alanine carboxypeptidase [Propionibacteriaceae bacterium]